MKIEKVEVGLQLGELSEKSIVKLEEGLGVKREGEGEETHLTLYADYEHVDEILKVVKDFLDHDIPVVMRKCYVELEE